jgi:hypothetical protein
MKPYYLLLLLFGCAPKVVYVPTETVRTEIQTVHDTVVTVKLDVIRDSVAVSDTLSRLSNKYAYSVAEWHSGVLNHSLGIKDIQIPIKVHYVNTTIRDTTKIATPISKENQKKIDAYDKLKESNKSKSLTIWKLIGALALCGLWILRKPIIAFFKLL